MAKGRKLEPALGKQRKLLRKIDPRHWTKPTVAAFMTRLAETCNVKEAALTAGMSPTGAYQKRRKDAAFRAAWAAALAEGYARLELMMLERALNGTEKIVRHKDGSEERVRQYSDSVALALLRQHRAAATDADNDPGPQEVEEARERILKKLAKLKARTGGEAACASEEEKPDSRFRGNDGEIAG